MSEFDADRRSGFSILAWLQGTAMLFVLLGLSVASLFLPDDSSFIAEESSIHPD
jgi:hypothetical protein